MNCPMETRENREWLLAHASRGLNAERAAALDGHVRECAACRGFVESQRAVWKALDLWQAPPAAADFDRRLERRIEREVTGWDRIARWLRPSPARRFVPLAATAAVLLAACLLAVRTPSALSTVETEALRPEQVVQALDEIDALSQFNHSLKAGISESRM